MNGQTTDLLDVLAVIVLLTLGLGLIVWQIFRAESNLKKGKKA
jgi:hypothetical protein